jgi:hypothetical protein
VRDDADTEGREGDRAHRQLKDDAQVRAEIAPHGGIGTRREERWEKQHQCQVRIEVDGRRARDECQRSAPENESCGGRHAQAARQQFEADDHAHEKQRELEECDPGQDAARLR